MWILQKPSWLAESKALRLYGNIQGVQIWQAASFFCAFYVWFGKFAAFWPFLEVIFQRSKWLLSPFLLCPHEPSGGQEQSTIPGQLHPGCDLTFCCGFCLTIILGNRPVIIVELYDFSKLSEQLVSTQFFAKVRHGQGHCTSWRFTKLTKTVGKWSSASVKAAQKMESIHFDDPNDKTSVIGSTPPGLNILKTVCVRHGYDKVVPPSYNILYPFQI